VPCCSPTTLAAPPIPCPAYHHSSPSFAGASLSTPRFRSSLPPAQSLASSTTSLGSLPTSPMVPSTAPPSGHCRFPIVIPRHHREQPPVIPSSPLPPLNCLPTTPRCSLSPPPSTLGLRLTRIGWRHRQAPWGSSSPAPIWDASPEVASPLAGPRHSPQLQPPWTDIFRKIYSNQIHLEFKPSKFCRGSMNLANI
jgi:hypothetical protein